jgi:hypothetical protein
VQAAVEVANTQGISIDIVASRRQVDKYGGYVYPNQQALVDHVQEHDVHKLVRVCRDHGGPRQGSGTGDWDLEENEAIESFEADIAAGFDTLHIDLCELRLDDTGAAITMIDYMRELLYDDERFELGSEEQDGNIVRSVRRTQVMLDAVLGAGLLPFVDYVVVQTGTRVVEMRNVQTYTSSEEVSALTLILDALKPYGVGLKEHNGDYLHPVALKLRRKLGVHGVNIAPEYGVIETHALLFEAAHRSMPNAAGEFLRISYDYGGWKKWMVPGSTASSTDRAIIGGHYVFEQPNVIELKELLGDDIDEVLRGWIRRRIRRHALELSDG